MKDLISKLTNKILNETIEERANEVMEKLKGLDEGGKLCECGSGLMESECNECGMNEGKLCECGSGLMEAECNECGMNEEEMEEGNAFGKAVRDAKRDKKTSFKFKGDRYPVKETYILSIDGKKLELTEEKLIDIIEDIVILEEKKLKGAKPKGYAEYERVVKKSKKENDDYIKDVVKKIKDYLKDGSKGDFEMEPKMFPKGNGELAKMKAKKYTMSDDGKEFLDDFMHPGMEDLVPDEIQYDEDWVDDLIDGSSRTGNNPEWANAEETDLGKKLNKKRKAKKYHKAKMMAYRKSPQPVTDGPGENSGSGVNIKLESTNEKQQQKLNEEFSRISELMNYNKPTQ